jgi:hypothetical protein
LQGVSGLRSRETRRVEENVREGGLRKRVYRQCPNIFLVEARLKTVTLWKMEDGTSINTLRTSPDGKTHTRVDHILIDRRRHSSVLDVRSFTAADCDTDHYLLVANVRERLAANKQGSHKFHMQRFNLNKLIGVGVKRSIVFRSHVVS